MFETLYDKVFPNIALFFQYLIAFAELKPEALLIAIDSALETGVATLFLDSTNFWTGLNGLDNVYFDGITLNLSFLGTTIWGRGLALLAKPLLTVFFAPTANLPMWLALPISFAVYGVLLSLTKFVIKVLV